ncbi:hypothetical protein B0H16DRAFT_1465105 [Mycena metata]|uniref:Uncharacterized protein n=1 Tax=Mycena metata TaxID=1033252 RepID=A0AAD7N074_9AGAR|nr:hypothetical protein B0H16DRAFT_1465105 [Mycena metata]
MVAVINHTSISNITVFDIQAIAGPRPLGGFHTGHIGFGTKCRCCRKAGFMAQDDPSSLPCLKTLDVFNSPVVNYEQLVAFLHRRTTSTKLARLQSLRLVYRPGVLLAEDTELDPRYFVSGGRRWRLNATDHMRRLASEGMDIHIGSENTPIISLDKWVAFDAQPEGYDSADEYDGDAGEESDE